MCFIFLNCNHLHLTIYSENVDTLVILFQLTMGNCNFEFRVAVIFYNVFVVPIASALHY